MGELYGIKLDEVCESCNRQWGAHNAFDCPSGGKTWQKDGLRVIEARHVRVNEQIEAFSLANKVEWHTCTWLVGRVDPKDGPYLSSGARIGAWHVLGWFKVRVPRPGDGPLRSTNAPTISAGKVKDWPLTCPRCKRPDSAYLGLNDYDCKYGCYARPASAKG